MKGFGLTTAPGIQVLSAYSSPSHDIESVAATPGWEVVGAFYLPVATALRIEMIGLVSDLAVTMRARFFDMKDLVPVTSTYATIHSLAEVRVLSGVVQLQGARLYQLQVEVTGADGQFGVARSVAPTVE